MNETSFHAVPLGAPGRPYPVLGPSRVIEGGKMVPPQLEALERPVDLYSKRPYAEVMGLAYRETPYENMLPIFYQLVLNCQPDSPRKVDLVLGPPGAGKTHMANFVARLMSREGAIMANCTGNVEKLLFETVLDRDAGRSLYDKIDEKLADGTLKPLSLTLLKESLGEAFSEAGGKPSIDWNKAVDPKAIDGLEKVRVLEGLEATAGGLAIKTRFGPLIKAWQEGRYLIGDEYTKADPETDSKLHLVWQVLNGELAETTVEGGGGLSFTFRAADFKPGFHCTLTGNTTADGVGTHDLSRSAYDRLRPLYVPEATEAEYQHQMTYLLTGLPVFTHEKMIAGMGKADPKAVAALLKTWRELGLSQGEKENIPDWQERMLDNKKNVLQAVGQLAKFYDKWATYLDTEAPNRPAEILMEVDEMDRDRVNPGLRMIIKHFNQALQPAPDSVPLQQSSGFNVAENWNEAPANAVQDLPPPDRYFGTNLSRVIIQEIENTTLRQDKPNLYKLLLKEAADCGIAVTAFEDASANPNLQPIAKLLDIEPYSGVQLTEGTEALQKALCAQLRAQYPKLSSNDNDVIKPMELQLSLNKLAEERAKLETPEHKFLAVANPHFLDGSIGKTAPLVLVPVIDPVFSGNSQEPAKDILSLQDTLTALAYPEIGEQNLNALWNLNLAKTCGLVNVETGEIDRASAKLISHLAMAENEASNGVAVTTLLCANIHADPKENRPYDELRILRNSHAKKTLITGETEITPALSASLKEAGILYINRNDKKAEEKVGEALKTSIFAGKTLQDAEIADLLSAFKLRQDKNLPATGEEKLPLVASLARRSSAASHALHIELPELAQTGAPTVGAR